MAAGRRRAAACRYHRGRAPSLARSLTQQEKSEPGTSLARRQPAHPPALGLSRLRAATEEDGGSWSELHLKLIERLGPPSLLVNGEEDIVHLSGTVGQFLQFAAGEPSTNLFRVVHPMLRVELRAAVFRARQTEQTSSLYGVPVLIGDEKRRVDIHVGPAADLAADFLLVSFELKPNDESEQQLELERNEPVADHLERELEQTKLHLRDLVEQHKASTEELKASNEELQAMNEELRSATEELETSREELQSINEELTTVNLELKSKVDELAHTNSDLHNLMGATKIATVFLDRELKIMRFTPPAVDLFRLIPTDVGRPLGDLQHRLEYHSLITDAARVLQQLVPIERKVGETGGRFFLVRLLPYRTTDDRIAGVVLTFVDVTESHLAQTALESAQEELEGRVRQRTAELGEANEALRNQVLMHERAEQARQSLQSRLLTAQEEERSRISRELHDHVGQQVTALMITLKALESSNGNSAHLQKLRELRELADNIGRDVHQVATQLRPMSLDQMGLPDALAGYLQTWSERSGIGVDFNVVGLEGARLPGLIETTLYRIVQEAMNNVFRHAKAASVTVRIERDKDQVSASIEDDGAGFELDVIARDSLRIGVAGMPPSSAESSRSNRTWGTEPRCESFCPFHQGPDRSGLHRRRARFVVPGRATTRR